MSYLKETSKSNTLQPRKWRSCIRSPGYLMTKWDSATARLRSRALRITHRYAKASPADQVANTHQLVQMKCCKAAVIAAKGVLQCILCGRKGPADSPSCWQRTLTQLIPRGTPKTCIPSNCEITFFAGMWWSNHACHQRQYIRHAAVHPTYDEQMERTCCERQRISAGAEIAPQLYREIL